MLKEGLRNMHRIVMGRISWVCATCAEHFTRKYSASRHNTNLHFGNEQIVRLLDYIIGRASGKYLPSDPRPAKTITPLFMIILLNGNQNRFHKVLPIIIGHTQPTAIITICMKTHLLYYYPTSNTINNADDKPANKVQDRIRKYDELKTLVGKYDDVEAEKTLAIVRRYMSLGDDRLLDEQLTFFRKLDGR